jgi:hypothetical protein
MYGQDYLVNRRSGYKNQWPTLRIGSGTNCPIGDVMTSARAIWLTPLFFLEGFIDSLNTSGQRRFASSQCNIGLSYSR